MRKACINCRYYKEVHASSIPQGGIFPGSGECLFNPPVVFLVDNAPESYRPIVSGIDFCGHFEEGTRSTLDDGRSGEDD